MWLMMTQRSTIAMPVTSTTMAHIVLQLVAEGVMADVALQLAKLQRVNFFFFSYLKFA
jgi:hypothetical protein